MNRGLMRTMVRWRVQDRNSTRWTIAEIDAELDFAAQDIAIQLAKSATTSFCRKTFALTTAGGTDPYPITVTDFHSIRDMHGSATYSGRHIAEEEYDRLKEEYPDGMDQDGKWLYYLIYSPNQTVLVTVTGSPTGGTFDLTFDGQTAADIPYDVTVAALQTALEALSNINVGDVEVSGADGGPYTIEFKGQYAGRDVPDMTGDGGDLTGGTSPDITVQNYHYSVQFVGTPSVPFTLVYNILVPSIPSGSTADVQIYSTVPTQFHETVVQRVVMSLLGHTAASTANFASGLWAHLAKQAGFDVADRADPFRTSS